MLIRHSGYPKGLTSRDINRLHLLNDFDGYFSRPKGHLYWPQPRAYVGIEWNGGMKMALSVYSGAELETLEIEGNE